MDDFIFGTLASDELKLNYHRIARSGLQHNYERQPRDPKPGEPVTLAVYLAQDVPLDTLAAYVTFDGTIPQGTRGRSENGLVIPFERESVEWDSLLWGYLSRWQAVLPGHPAGTVIRYRISGWRGEGEEIFADWPDVKASTDRTAASYFRGGSLDLTWAGSPSSGTTFTFHIDNLTPPDWARSAVLYQVFVDRFNPGGGRGWLQTSDLKSAFGGTLEGVTEKLSYIEDLGADCIWVSPIFPSPTIHGYDAVDLMRVEPRLGGDAALRELVQAAHRRGIRVLLDLVCNHISNQHPIFLEARKDPGSRYRNWFFFDDSAIGYRTFFGVASMPQLNLADSLARDWMLETARFWLREFDVDGYRLDHAHGPGPGFWADFWAVCKEEKPESFCFGELVEPVDVVRRYCGSMDGVLDFHVADALRRTYGPQIRSELELDGFLANHLEASDPDFLHLTFVDNHDMDRFLYLVDGDKERLKRAVEVQMRLPGPPVIYYGTEVGLGKQQAKSSEIGLEASRMQMLWEDQQDQDLLKFYKERIRERRQVKPWIRAVSR